MKSIYHIPPEKYDWSVHLCVCDLWEDVGKYLEDDSLIEGSSPTDLSRVKKRIDHMLKWATPLPDSHRGNDIHRKLEQISKMIQEHLFQLYKPTYRWRRFSM